jgi:hypothetical protein
LVLTPVDCHACTSGRHTARPVCRHRSRNRADCPLIGSHRSGHRGRRAARQDQQRLEERGEQRDDIVCLPLTLSAASDAAVTVNFVTADGYARAPEDYEAKSGSLDFAAGTTSKTITVNVKGDRTREWDEVFYVNLSGAAGAVIQAGRGTGVVRNDDDR